MKLLNRISAWACRPPYEGVLWLSWIYVVFACLVRGGGPFDGNLAWFDDHVRMVQVLDWINGNSWYDHTISRVNAPEGFHTIWSRLVDIPIAAIIVPLQGFIGQYQAAMTASILLPLLQVLFLFQAASYLALPLVGKPNARLIVLFVLFSSCINAEYFTLAGFQLGAVGHHAWYVIFTILMCGAATRLLLGDDKKHLTIAATSITALLAIGIEGIPLIGGLCTTLALVSWVFNRADISRRAASFTALGALGALILLPANQPPEKLLSVSFAEASIFGPLLVGCAALFFTAQFFVLQKFGQKKIIGFVFMVTFVAMLTGLLIYCFPQMLDGPAAALSPEERATAAMAHTEAMPLFRVAFNKLDCWRLAMPCALALIYGLYRLTTANRKDAPIICTYLGFAIVPCGMALALSRYYHHAVVMCCPFLTLALIDAWRRIPSTKAHHLMGLLAFIALGPLWTFLIPAAMNNIPFGTNVLLFPAKRQDKNDICDPKSISVFLDQHYKPDTTIMVPMYRSAQFLFHTHLHIFFLANFPSDNKFLVVKKFYETRDPNEAHKIAMDHNIDLVTACRLSPMIHSKDMIIPGLSAPASNFTQQLLDGVIPDWLVPVKVDQATPYLLFAVKH